MAETISTRELFGNQDDIVSTADLFGGDEKPMPLTDVGKQALSNIPQSAVNYGQAMISPLVHPVDTVNNLRDVIFGGLGKVIPGADVGDQQSRFDALTQALKQRYGGYENIKKTIATDPVGVAADVSSIFTGGGSLAARAPGLIGKVGQATANAGRILEPVNAIKQTVGGIAGKVIPNNAAMRLYESSLKPPAPSAKFTREDQLRVLQEGLDAGIQPSQFGIDKLQGLIDDINGKIFEKIQSGSNQKSTTIIYPTDVVKRLDETEAFFSNMPNSKPYLNAIAEVRQGMLERGALSLDKAQKMKQTIYRVMNDSYGELSTATKEANKAVARGIKEEIVNIFPEINTLNKQESLYLKLEPMIEKAAGRIDKRDLMGIGTPLAGGMAGGILGPKAGAMIWLTKAIMDNPNIKAYLAIALNKANKGGIGKGYIDQRLAAYLSGKLNETQSNADLQ